MSVAAGLIGFLAGAAACGLAALAYRRSVPDHASAPPPSQGLQGRVARWCHQHADVRAAWPPQRNRSTIDWALTALESAGRIEPVPPRHVQRRAHRAHRAHRARHARRDGEPLVVPALPADPLLAALAQGRPDLLRRVHLERRYQGPPALFFAWYAFVQIPRHGRKALTLDALAEAIRTTEDP